MFLDLKDFKTVNDQYGHDYGDDLLLKFSVKLKNAIRNTDFCARLAGDEFVILSNCAEKPLPSGRG